MLFATTESYNQTVWLISIYLIIKKIITKNNQKYSTSSILS